MTRSFLISFFLFCFCISCSKKQVASKEEVFSMAYAIDPKIELVIPDSISSTVVNCSDYDPPCAHGHKVRIKKIDLIALEYLDAKMALSVAKKINGYAYYNWVFDLATGEPVLERFIEKAYGVKKARSLDAK